MQKERTKQRWERLTKYGQNLETYNQAGFHHFTTFTGRLQTLIFNQILNSCCEYSSKNIWGMKNVNLGKSYCTLYTINQSLLNNLIRTNYWKYWMSKHPVKWHELTIQTLLCRPHDIPIIIYNITFTEYKNYIYYFKPKDGSYGNAYIQFLLPLD